MDKKIFAFIIFFLIFAALSNPLEASRHHQGRSSAGRRALSPQADESVEKSPGRINDAYVIHFILDGTNAEAFENAREKGLLPNISNMFFENGAVFEKGLSLFPSTSTTVYQSYATGLLPGRSGIPHLQTGIQWRLSII